jgi:hypothetical protein
MNETRFTQDNTRGFTDSELDRLNELFVKLSERALEGLDPDFDGYIIHSILINLADEILNNH